MFLRLWTRAPCTAIVVRAVPSRVFLLVRFTVNRSSTCVGVPEDERQLLHLDVAPLRQLHGYRRLPDNSLIGKVLAGRGHVGNVVMTFEVVSDVSGRARFAHLAQMIQDQAE